MELSAYDKIIRAKVQLQMTKPFFSYLTKNLRCVEATKEEGVETMAVDIKGNLYYNKDWVGKLSEQQIEGVLVHEVLHIVLQHLLRLGTRDHELFNCCNDLVINDILVAEGMSLPEGLIPDYDHKYLVKEIDYTVEKINEKSSEQIYEELYQKFKGKNNSMGSSGKGKISKLDGKRFDEHRYADGSGEEEGKEKKKGLSEAEIKKVSKVWKDRLAEATSYAHQRGLLPKGMGRFIDEILDEKVNWRHKLYKYITAELPYDFTYARPSKKSISTGVYMPSVLKETIQMVVAVDTSGSIGQKELTEFLSEICHIAKSFTNIDMDLVVCDSQIHNEYKIANGSIGEILGLEVGGGGGTSHRPVVDWVNENKPNTKLLISLTDGWSDIESVYEDLPYNCHSVIVLTEHSCEEKQLQDYGEIIKL